MLKTVVVVLLLILPIAASSQEGRPWEELLANVLTAEDLEAATWEDTYEMLCELEEQPMNLNTATREDLEALPFLSERQVEDLMEYLYRYGSMKSLNELRMIRSLDHVQMALLPYFTFVEEEHRETYPPVKDILQYGRHEAMANVRIPFYKRKGDNNGYLGYPYRHWLRYQFNYRDYVKAGLIGSQDAGEPFFAHQNTTGYDSYSYYVQVKHLDRLENAVVGKYKLSIGMGLVVNNSFGMGKLATLQQLGRNNNIIRPHSSRSQTDYLQGAAATVKLSPRWQATGFVSYRPFDATLNADGTARTIVTEGYHRTPTEMGKKNNCHATDAGAHVGYRHRGLHAGATILYTHLDRPLRPDTKTLYRRHQAQGSDFLNVGADYGYLHPRFSLSGETAINFDGAVATINTLSSNVADGLNVLLLQRFYSYRYTALYARSMTEGGHVQNESGIYAGLTWQYSPRLRLQAYTDYAYFAWARYQVSQSSRAWDNLITATYDTGNWTLTGRYRLHLRQRDDETKQTLVNLTEHRGRLSLTWQHGTFSCTTQADGVYTGENDRGYMVSEAANYKWCNLRLSLNGGYFHTDSYDSRLYVYERGPLYSFSFPSFYGEGMRLALMVQTVLMQRLTLTAKAGMTRYFDRSTIGSGLQQINSATQTDLDLQVRWKL